VNQGLGFRIYCLEEDRENAAEEKHRENAAEEKHREKTLHNFTLYVEVAADGDCSGPEVCGSGWVGCGKALQQFNRSNLACRTR
jgi:hypothetical protein